MAVFLFVAKLHKSEPLMPTSKHSIVGSTTHYWRYLAEGTMGIPAALENACMY
ncbi:hypothetical protein [Carnimonas bestiolae]|uniref:hypothetical protein n=1 Tax=Carnimonas bestiolae TaxID=3402172 RepID=UPI003F4ADDEA